jgi:rare lipoprotein A
MNAVLRQICAVFALAVLAAGCATQAPPAVQPSSNAGAYKVGNPYQVGGTWYYPREQPDYDETGIASWYGPNFYGKQTADGEVYDAQDLTAAHRTLPMPVNVRVTNLENGKSLVVRVNDRGPFSKGRIIDLSERAAKLLGFYDQGTARIRVVFLGRADLPNGQPQPTGAGTPPEIASAAAAAPSGKVETSALPAKPGVKSVDAPASRPAAEPPPAVGETVQDTKPDGKVSLTSVPAMTHLYVQVGAFSNYQNAERLVARLGGALRISAIKRNGASLYRVRMGPFDKLGDADAALQAMINAGSTDAQIVVDQ